MDLTSESHYKEYGLFTYIEARKLNQRSKAVQNGIKNSRITHTQLVLQFKVVFGLKIYKPVCTLCFSLFQIVLTVLWRRIILKAYIFKPKKNLKRG